MCSIAYRAFGLAIRCNLPIPALASAADESTGDAAAPGVLVDLAGNRRLDEPCPSRKLWYESAGDTSDSLLRVWKGSGGCEYLFAYGDGAQFRLDGSGCRIRATWPESLTLDDVATYLLGPILGFVLRLRGIVCLHASAIAVGDRCIGILAPAGHGKSTTAAAFARLGHPVLTDDILALVDGGDRFLAQPGYPRLRLWPRSVEALFGTVDALPRITPEHPVWDKRYLDLSDNGFRFQRRPLPLAAIYIGQRSEESPIPRLEPLSVREGLLVLVRGAYSSYLLDRYMRAQEFDLLSRLARSVAVKRFLIRKGIRHLPSLCDVILGDCGISSGRAAACPKRPYVVGNAPGVS